ncbi:hypothetical protein B0H13DRAFT_1885336 [Mycena leptocephala]|nr:hypothetical protein B0H13DRAFT_1885336 [Mycena leptocephala]
MHFTTAFIGLFVASTHAAATISPMPDICCLWGASVLGCGFVVKLAVMNPVPVASLRPDEVCCCSAANDLGCLLVTMVHARLSDSPLICAPKVATSLRAFRARDIKFSGHGRPLVNNRVSEELGGLIFARTFTLSFSVGSLYLSVFSEGNSAAGTSKIRPIWSSENP